MPCIQQRPVTNKHKARRAAHQRKNARCLLGIMGVRDGCTGVSIDVGLAAIRARRRVSSSRSQRSTTVRSFTPVDSSGSTDLRRRLQLF